MQRNGPSRELGCFRVLASGPAGERFLATSDILWHAQHLAQLRLGRVLTWRTIPDPLAPGAVGSVAELEGVTVRAAWMPFATTGRDGGIAGPGHLGG